MAIHNQRDPAGLIVFDDEVRNYVRPSTRQGQLFRLLAALEQAEPAARTEFAKPLQHFQQLLHRRGIVLVISDFYESPETIVQTIEPLRFHGSEVVLFHILDPKEIRPELKGPAILVDLETGEKREVIPDYVKTGYRAKMDAHLAALEEKAKASGLDYHLLVTDRPLDRALTEYITLRERKGGA
jgi:uncharacterized protein (DUF58 family)